MQAGSCFFLRKAADVDPPVSAKTSPFTAPTGQPSLLSTSVSSIRCPRRRFHLRDPYPITSVSSQPRISTMDSLVSVALEEICAGAAAGILLPELWPSLVQHASLTGLPLGPTVKQALWARLLALPVLKFELNGSLVDPSDPSIHAVDEADRYMLRVFADDSTRKSFLGLYDLKHCEISKTQMSTLEELGAARYKGVTQRDLCDKLGKKGNNFHYVVRFLESQRLIMRQSTLVREKKQGEYVECSGEPTSVVSTKSLYLSRYGMRLNLNSQQRIEIVKPNWNGEEGDNGNEEVSIGDPRPAMKAICDKLEEAKGKVLVVSDVKLAFGYRLTRGHKEWTSILNKLKAASLVEEFRAKVEGKDVSCLRLLRPYNEDEIQSKVDMSSSKGKGKRGEVTDQFVELPLEQRIYDLIESEGSKGITISEIASRLGLRGKKLETPMAILRTRFNMVWESETVDKVKQNRIWTRKNYGLHKSASTSRKTEMVPSTEKISSVQQTDLPRSNPDNSLAVVVHDVEDAKLDSGAAEQTIELRETITPSSSGAKRKKDWRYMCTPTNPSIAMREHRILQKLTEEGFLLVVELHKWLQSLDKEKSSSMDKKTLMRSLNKLQLEGKCKCIKVSMPSVSNCYRNRLTDVILQPSANSSSAELLDQVHKRFRKFEVDNRRSGLAKMRQNDNSDNAVVMPTRNLLVRPKEENVFIQAMRANGFLIAKMIRAKLLHKFLWGYVIGIPGHGDTSGSDEVGSSRQMFDRDKAIKEMPLELFLQVVGSAKKIDNMVSKCRLGLKLSEIPLKDYKSLMNYNATARLSRVIDILLRLKLIRLVRVSDLKDDLGDTSAETVLKHALELRPHIEESFLKTIPSKRARSGSRPIIRHDFILSKEAAVDAYWQTLEYCYATANYTSVSHAFPASAVPEVSLKRSWASLWVMTADQRTELLKRLENAGVEKIPLEKCVQIARELDLTVEQVLRASRERWFPCQNLKPNESGERYLVSAGVTTRKRKRSVSQFRTAQGLFRRSVRSQRFSWTDESDRQLIMRYTRNRVVMGARIHRVDWSSLPDLPAPPATCRRRMAWLRSHENIRRVLMRLCNHLSKRYAKYLEMARTKRKEISEEDPEGQIDPGQIDFCWDDFGDPEVKKVLDEVLEYRKLAKLASISKERPVSQDAKKGGPPGSTSEKDKKNGDADTVCTRDRKKENFERRFGDILNSRGEVIRKTVQESLAVANAVELLKLVFLSTVASENVQASVAATLQLYSESDIFTALTYLRDKNYMVVGQGNQPFVFSRKFFYSASSSPFPVGTGKRARELSSWLNQQEETLMSEGVSLFSDPQCGDAIHLLSLVSSGELNITPCVPEEGVGELDELEMPKRSLLGPTNKTENITNNKRKSDEADLGDGGEGSKKVKKADGRFLTRKVKGFPGLCVRVTREVAPLDYHAMSVVSEERFDSSSATLVCVTENQNELCASPVLKTGGSCWDDMKAYFSAISATDISSDVFRPVLSLIHKAGERGVGMEEISNALGLQGPGHVAEFIVETIEAFGFAIKVNGYDRVQVVHSSFRSKYHINSHTNLEDNTEALVKSQPPNFGASTNPDLGAPTISLGECHKATIIDGPNTQSEGVREDESNRKEENEEERELESACPSRVSWPILPWLNGDGSVNGTVYEALTRRILGTVMQKPGILEEEIIRTMDVLNPQSCKRLLKNLVLEKHLSVRTLYQTTSGPPSILQDLFTPSRSTKPFSVCRKHFFANPSSTSLL